MITLSFMRKRNQNTYRGKTFASKAELDFVKQLDDNGIDWDYESVRIPWIPDVCYYKPDFKIDGKIVEYKGYFRPTDRTMLLKIKEQHPDLDIHILFQKPNNRIHSSSSTTYKDWAEKHGFKVITVQDVLEGKLRDENQSRQPT